MMTARKGSEQEHKTGAAKPDKTKIALEKAKADAKAALTRVRAEEKARLKAEKALAEAQVALAAAQAEVEQERQARLKAEQVRTETEQALSEARQATLVKAEGMEMPPVAPGKEGAEQRVSFVVRLTVDEQGQPRRTEVEHAQSGQKETLPGLDVQRLVTFIQASLNPPVRLEPAVPLALAPAARVEAPRPQVPGPATTLAISDVGVMRSEAPGIRTLTLSSDEAFTIQARFQLEGSEAYSLTAQTPSYEMRIFVQEVISGAVRLLTTYRANLVENVLEYTAETQVPGLSTGLYRLITLVKIQSPGNLMTHHEGPIHVIGAHPSINPAIPLKALPSP